MDGTEILVDLDAGAGRKAGKGAKNKTKSQSSGRGGGNGKKEKVQGGKEKNVDVGAHKIRTATKLFAHRRP